MQFRRSGPLASLSLFLAFTFASGTDVAGHLAARLGDLVQRDPPIGGGPIHPSSTGTSSPVMSTNFVFDTVQTLTTCQSEEITWTYTGTSTNGIEIIVTNDGVEQSPPTTTTSSSGVISSVPNLTKENTPRSPLDVRRRQGLSSVDQPLSTTIDPELESYQWNPVNVTQGWYKFIAFLDISFAMSNAFFVTNGSNVACLSPSSSSTSSTGSSTSTHSSSSGASSSSHSHSSTSTSTSATKSPTLIASSSSSSRSSHTGAIAGGVIGGVAIIIAAIAAIFFLCRINPTRKRHGFAGREKKNWGGLASRDLSRNVMAGAKAPSGSMGNVPVLGATSRTGTGPTPGSSDDDIASYTGEVKSAPDQHQLQTGPPQALDSRSSFTPSVNANLPRSRTSFDGVNARPRSRQGQSRVGRTRSGGAQPTEVGVRSAPERRTSLDEFGRPNPIESIPMARTPSTHRTPRKPVPQYDAAELEAANPTDGAGQNPFDSDPSSPGTSAASHATSMLSHKSSFPDLNRPVHYLIPDMPPPAKQ